MIALLRGKLVEKQPNQVLIDVQGVGYEVVIPVSTFSSLPEAGKDVSLRIHTHVREDALSLFGFESKQEKLLFERLISVSGIGPKLAITILSGLPPGDLIQAIRNGSVEQLVRIPGIGKKTGERMVLELREKLDGMGLPPSATSASRPAALSPVEEDVLSALINLGCARPAAELAISKAKAAGAPVEFELLFRKSMKLIR